jgi:hypothetical protein
MMGFHLFCHPDLCGNIAYVSLFEFRGQGIESIVFGFGRVCISMFLFLSGYGLYISGTNHEKHPWLYVKKRLLNFYACYWVCFLVFVPVGLLFFSNYKDQNAWSWLNFINGVLGNCKEYNATWWFVKLYVELIILFPFIYALIKKNTLVALLVSFFVYLLPNTILEISPFNLTFIKALYLEAFMPFQMSFIVGCVAAKHGWFDCFVNKVRVYGMDNFCFYIVLCVLLFMLRHRFEIDPAISPLLTFSCILLFRTIPGKRIMITLGKYSVYMWLCHAFYCWYYTPGLIFYPKYSVLIYLWLVLLTLGSSVILKLLHDALYRVVNYVSVIRNG